MSVALSLIMLTLQPKRTPDDAYYYYKIAQNVATDRGFTFDGRNKTNGFQPLWQLILVIPYALAGGDKDLGLTLSVITEAIVLSLSALLVLLIAKRLGIGSGLPYFVALLFTLCALNLYRQGMETRLVELISLLAAFLLITRMQGRRDIAASVILGILMALFVLARLDGVLASVAILVVFLISRIVMGKKLFGADLRFLTTAMAVGAFTVGCWLIFSKLHFGLFFPISATCKVAYDKPFIRGLSLTGRQPVDIAILLAGAAALLLSYRSPIKNSSTLSTVRRLYCALLLTYTFAIGFHIAFMWQDINSWHRPYRVLTVIGGIVLLLVARPVFSRRAVEAVGAFGICILCVICAGRLAMLMNVGTVRFPSEAYAAAEWANRNLNKDAVVASSDCGIFGYYFKGTTINLDGLANNMELQEAVHKKRLESYLIQQGVTHIQQYAVWDDRDTNSSFNIFCLWPDALLRTLNDKHRYLKEQNVNQGRYKVFFYRFLSCVYVEMSSPLLIPADCEVYRGEPLEVQTSAGKHCRRAYIWRLPEKLVFLDK
jgi:hypothetical protein